MLARRRALRWLLCSDGRRARTVAERGSGGVVTSEHEQQRWPHLVVRAGAPAWVRRLVVLSAVVTLGVAAVITDTVASGIPTAIAGGVVMGSFVGVVVCLTAITVRWRTSVRSDGENLVLRDPLGARVVPLHVDLGLVRWLEPRTLQPVLWVSDHGALIAPISPLLSPLKVEGFVIALGLIVVDVDAPPSSRSI